ncbi:PadR family transcriptional regulator [Actinokineospora enzanensis]|uniref:PadR family transcriptional regulator n=1 Tax=Actinokineospora enzanensis TaxID=155975 RepID=UPI00035CC0C8|nr:PadR family transcriptional regulator [Actinokineospora enzanensis]
MARVSQSEMAVLGALSVRPMTGYAVREAIRTVLGHFWNESYGQIYPTLTRLHTEGLLDRHGGERSGSMTYSLTTAGRARLSELLRQPESPRPERNGLLLRLFFGRELGVDACVELVQAAKVDAEQRLANYAAIRATMATEEEDRAHHPFWLLTVSAGEHGARATLAWADETLRTLRGLAAN